MDEVTSLEGELTSETLRVWVADDLVHQIEIADAEQVVRTRFSDFGAEITITAPPSPYIPAGDD